MQMQPDYADYWDKSFIAGLKKERTAQGMSQTDLAERMSALGYKFHQATVYKIENGDRKVSAAEAWGLAEVLDVPIDDLYDYESAHSTDDARLRLIRTQADNIIQLLVKIDDLALRLRTAQKAFGMTVEMAQQDGLTEQAHSESPEVPVAEYFGPLLSLGIHDDILNQLRDAWVGDLGDLAGVVSGVMRFADVDFYESN